MPSPLRSSLTVAESSVSSGFLIDAARPSCFQDPCSSCWLWTSSQEREHLLDQSLRSGGCSAQREQLPWLSPRASFLDFCSRGQKTRVTWAVVNGLIHLSWLSLKKLLLKPNAVFNPFGYFKVGKTSGIPGSEKRSRSC